MHPPGLNPTEDTLTLHRFKGEFESPFPETEPFLRVVGLDVETTGLHQDRDQIIEIGIMELLIDPQGHLLRPGRSISALQDPQKPLPTRITEITGITDADLAGQSIDWDSVNAIFADANWIVAHNAAFDRPFVDRRSALSRQKAWACSMSQIPWAQRGHRCRTLEHLLRDYGLFFEAHRALMDVKAMARLLLFESPLGTGNTLLAELFESASQPDCFIQAFGSPFETKEQLKQRGFRWNRDQRVWETRVGASQVEEMRKFLETEIYPGPCTAKFHELDPKNRFQKS